MTVKEMNQAIGQEIGVRLGDFVVRMTIIDIKQAYGRVRFLVEPDLAWGSGQQWVEIDRLQKVSRWEGPAQKFAVIA